jgi:hypothetical protein
VVYSLGGCGMTDKRCKLPTTEQEMKAAIVEESRRSLIDGVCDYPGCRKDATEELLPSGPEYCAEHADECF